MSKQNVLVIIAFVAMLGIVGCSDSDKATAPLAPVGDTVAPVAVELLNVNVVQHRNPGVILSWKTAPELDLAGYRVYRSANGGTGELVATTTQASWRDESVQKGVNYVYSVSAFDESDNEGVRTFFGSIHIEAPPIKPHTLIQK